MSVHEQYAEDLALYAMGALPEGERAAVEKHLQGCADCRGELEMLRGDAALLAYSAAHSIPPRRSRQRLMDAVRSEPRKKEVRAARTWWNTVPWLAAAAMTILAVLLMRQNGGLQQELASLRDRTSEQQAQLEQAREVVATLTATDAMRVTLVAAKTPPQPQGKAIYVRDRGSLIFLASNFQPVASGKAYELWLIPIKGNPIPAGVFKPDAHGSATVVNPPLPHGVEAKAFAITIEPQAGSEAPTSPVVMLGAGE
ncbi:MAG: anti-sigma factor [Terriglobales bacterium]